MGNKCCGEKEPIKKEFNTNMNKTKIVDANVDQKVPTGSERIMPYDHKKNDHPFVRNTGTKIESVRL